MISKLPWRSRKGVMVLTFVLLSIFGSVSCTNLEDELRITYEQKFAIDKLRQRILPYLVESYMKDDLYLVRWLRATKFNIDEAQKRILENIKWRKQNKMAAITREDFGDLKDEYPYLFTADKQGQPSFIGFAGEWDVRNAVLSGRATRVIRYINQAMEMAAKQIRELQYQGKNITRLNLIIDLDGFNIPQHGCVACLFRILDFLLLYDNNYPGLADHIVFTNTPPTIAAAAELVRNNANSETMKSIKVYGRDKKVWQRALQAFINKDRLPIELGGTKKRNEFPNVLQ